MAQFDSYAPGTPCWVDLMTPDIEAAASFYGELFGWEAQPAFDGEGNRIYTNFLNDGRTAAGMGEMPPDMAATGMPPVWSTYISTADADATAAKVTEAGGTVVMPPMDVMSFGRMLVAQDTTGAMVSFWQPGDTIGAQVANEPGAFCWNELQTRDVEGAIAFYRAVVGWTATTSTDAGMPYTEFANGDATIAGMMPMPPMVPAEVPPYWLTYFAVDSCDAAVAAVQAGGGNVLVPAMTVPVGTFSVVTDPRGGTFAVIALSGEGM